MKIMAPGLSLYEAQCLVVFIIFQLILLFTLSGYRIVVTGDGTGPDGLPHCRGPARACSGVVLNVRGIFPASAGFATGSARSLLHTQ